MIYVFSTLLAAALGFAAHRASVCTVKAVAEVVSTGQGYLFLSFAKTILWVMAITIPLGWWLPDAFNVAPYPGMSTGVLLGGLLFGMGAALNKGCAFSTLSRLSDGQLSMLMTLVGFCGGIYTHIEFSDVYALPRVHSLETGVTASGVWELMLIGALWLWAMHEGIRLWRTRRPRTPWRQLVHANRYRLSTAAAVLGIANGVLYAVHGTWAYTSTIGAQVHHFAAGEAQPSTIRWSLLAAVLFGMLWSSWQRRSFHLDWRPSFSWIVSLLAGWLMGIGAAMIPGSNDVLILHAIPALSPYALPAYAAIVTGIALPVIFMRVFQGAVMHVSCSNDVCRTGRDRFDAGSAISGADD